MDLSIIIVNYNTAQYLVQALESIRTYASGIQYEVIVVDNASSDNSSELLRKLTDIRLISNTKNAGFAAGMNQALKESQGRFILWMNPDSQLLNHGLQTLIRYLEKQPKVGILGPRIVNPDGTIQFSCRSFPSYFAAIANRHSLFTKWFPRNRFSQKYLKSDFDHDSIHEVDWVSGACLLHKREILETIGYLDEKFFMYCEDVDFCLRATQKGWKIQFHPGATFVHEISGSSRSVPRKMIIERHRSIWSYYTKHFPRNPAKDAVIGAGILTRCGFLLVQNLIFSREQV